MTGVGNLRNIFELVIDGFNQRAFTNQHSLKQGHQPVFHILTSGGNQFEVLFEKVFKEFLGNIAFIAHQLTPQLTSQSWNGLSVINLAGSQTKSQNLALVIDDKM